MKRTVIQWVKSFLGGMVDAVAEYRTMDNSFEDLKNLTPFVSEGELLLRRGCYPYWHDTAYYGTQGFTITKFEEVMLRVNGGLWRFLCGLNEDADNSGHWNVWYRPTDTATGYAGRRHSASTQHSDPYDTTTAQSYEQAVLTPWNVRFAGAPPTENRNTNYTFTTSEGETQAVVVFGMAKDRLGAGATTAFYAVPNTTFIRPPTLTYGATVIDAEIWINPAHEVSPPASSGNYDYIIGVTLVLEDGQETPMSYHHLYSSKNDSTNFTIKVSYNIAKIREWAVAIRVWVAKIDTSSTAYVQPSYREPDWSEQDPTKPLSVLAQFRFAAEISLSSSGGTWTQETTYTDYWYHSFVVSFNGKTGSNDEGLGELYYVLRGDLYSPLSLGQTSEYFEATNVLASYKGGCQNGGRIWAFGVNHLDMKTFHMEPKSGQRLYFSYIHSDGTSYWDYFLKDYYLEVGDAKSGPITAVIPFQNDILIFTQNSTYRLAVSGAITSWILRKVFNQGIDQTTAVIATDNGVYFANQNGAFYYGSGAYTYSVGAP